MGILRDYPRITPFLWFDSNAEEAVAFYLAVFKNSRRLDGGTRMGRYSLFRSSWTAKGLPL